MVKIILLLVGLHAIAAFAAFIPSTFSRSQGGHHNYLFHQSSRPQKQHEGSSSYWSRNSNMRMNAEGELPEVDIQAAIYDVANVVDQQTSELRKAGVQLTQAMRNLEAEHRAELDNLDELIAATKRKKGYVEFAYNCFKL